MKAKRTLTQAEIASFCFQTAMLIQAGITPVESMSIMLSDMKNDQGREILQGIWDVCKKGTSFHEALESVGVFPDYCLRLIALGEESGKLDSCLQSLAVYYDKEENIRKNIKQAVSYPLIMIVMMFVVIYVLMSRVLPIFSQVFAELGSDMGGLASSLMNMGSTLNRYSGVLLGFICLLLALYFSFTRIPALKRLNRRFLNWFPPTRSFFEKYACQRFASGLAMTFSSGIDTYTSLEMVAELVGNPRMREQILQCQERLHKGDNLSEALVESQIFSNVHSRMVAIGFRSGNIDTVMQKIADSYEKETDERMQSIISVLEPTLVIILSIIVGLILLSVILPLMGIMSSIG